MPRNSNDLIRWPGGSPWGAVASEGIDATEAPEHDHADRHGGGPNAYGVKLYRRAIAEAFPLVYACGAWPKPQSPEKLSDSALLSSLYYGGWFLWHSDVILAKDHPEQHPGASGQDYLGRITAMHKRLDQLLTQPRSQWPDPPPGMTR